MTDKEKKAFLSKIVQVDFPEDQYYKLQTPKKQIVIHHTASGVGPDGDLRHWIGTKARIATHIIIGRDGTMYQCFSSKYWAHHLGVKSVIFKQHGFNDYGIRNKILNQESIAIELDNWGGLKQDKDGNWLTWTGKVIDKKKVQEYPEGFRGHLGYEKYPKKQLDAMARLIRFWHDRYGIPMKYDKDMWDVSKKALSGKPGIYTHVSYRPDKSDCHPQPELIETLKSLS